MKRPLVTMTAALALAAAILAVVRTERVPALADLIAIDNAIHHWVVSHQSGAWTTVMTVVTQLGGGTVVVAVTGLLVGFAAYSRRWAELLALVVTVAGGAMLSDAVKAWIARERPPVEAHLVIADNPAFPSGHAVQAIVCYMGAALIFGRRWWLIPAAAIAVAIGASRVYLGVHWPSDVVGGWVLGACWLTAVVAALTWWRQRRHGGVPVQSCAAASSNATVLPSSSSAAS